ncbi:unnamed protein product, partial [Effrenium voratum]
VPAHGGTQRQSLPSRIKRKKRSHKCKVRLTRLAKLPTSIPLTVMNSSGADSAAAMPQEKSARDIALQKAVKNAEARVAAAGAPQASQAQAQGTPRVGIQAALEAFRKSLVRKKEGQGKKGEKAC